MEVSLVPGARATVLTQAASKAYRGGASCQLAAFRLGAFLENLPHHLIPYAGSSYGQEITFDLSPDAVLLAWDAYGAGRVASASCGR